jgi:hypothetical protein
MHSRFSGPKTTSHIVNDSQEASASSKSLPLHSCDLFFYGGMGIIGMNSKDHSWLNWNGEILPMKQAGRSKFLITGVGRHTGKIVRFRKGGKGNPYVFIETTPKTEKVITPVAFKAVQPGPWNVGSAESARITEIEILKLQRDLPIGQILDAQGTYISTKGAKGAPPITIGIDEAMGTISVMSEERLDAQGHPIEIPMTISSSKNGVDGQLNELWLIGNFMRVPLYQLKLSKQDSGKWMLEVIDFSSKDSVDKML